MFWKDQLPHYLKLKLLSVHQIFCEILANILASLATSCLVPLGVPGLFSRSCAELLRDTLGVVVGILSVFVFVAGCFALNRVMKISSALLPNWNSKLRLKKHAQEKARNYLYCRISSGLSFKIWFLTFNPIAQPMISAKMTKRHDKRNIFEKLYRHE